MFILNANLKVVFKLFILSFTIFFALQKSPQFDWIYLALASINEQDSNSINSEEYSEVINLFETILKKPEVYTTEVLSLKAMSYKIGVPTRLLSNAVNHHYGESYSKYMNRMRIKFAEKLLKDNPELSIINIMYDSGFRTKSSFNREFKTITRVSPTDYRNTL